ncbi:hypothetical protein K2X30_14655 [bacterium]|jgi:hypothetical protein|nr:hypothetical protein [bacterium]
MKKLVSLFVLAFAINAQAGDYKTYNCSNKAGSSDSYVTPDDFTIQVSDEADDAAIISQLHKTSPASSFSRASDQSIPAAIEGSFNGGSKYTTKKNPNSFFSSGDACDYEVLFAFISNGLIRHNDSGSVKVAYKATDKCQPSTNKHQWTREYACQAK